MNKSYNPCDDCQYNHSKQNQESGMCKYCEFKKYIDLEEQGLILRLPCKVGDTVYIITKVFNGKEVIGAIGRRKIDSIGGNALNPIYVISKEPYELRFCPSEFGVRVFKTKEKAEAKLKEMEVGE